MKGLAGCYTYLISRNPEEANAVYVLEVWENKEAHQASPLLDHVRQLIEKAKPIIAGMNSQPDLNIIGGHLKFQTVFQSLWALEFCFSTEEVGDLCYNGEVRWLDAREFREG
ncbi:putative quinol monooxygenase [Streptococcus oricebi]|uniref:ABM domain-containing protein n=1 Tax=Streptococcus oricebi TaxID=1547447 RepID=A0ABS5B0V1_9STRE|nr:antibiotic biosynthesis monooxygenase [Streptococcus oricebi]MBP2622456.1 hypothetical protein [Streptococcus oricebi]